MVDTTLNLNYKNGMGKYFETQEPVVLERKDINLKVPNNGKTHVQVLHDWDVTGQSRAHGNKTAHPAIVNTAWGLITKYNDKVYDYVELPEKWQWIVWEFCKWSTGYQIPDGEITSFYTKTTNSGLFAKTTPYSLTEYYVSIMEKSRAWTDSWSPEIGARDYVTKRNLQNRNLEFLMRHTTGALHEVTLYGSKWIVKALDITKDPPPFEEIIADPTLYYWATQISNVQLPDKTWQVSYFPQAKRPSLYYELPFKGVAMPLLSMGGSFMIDKKACTPILKNGSAWSPYHP
jgi:hypothetical protein